MNQQQQLQDSAYFFFVFLKRWKLLLLITLLGAIASVIVAYNLQVWYAAKINLVPSTSSQESGNSAGSTISSALKEFGLTKMSSSSNQEAYSYIVILNSRFVIDSLINKYRLDSVYKIPKYKITKLREAFIDNIEVAYEKEGNYTITIWDSDKKRAADIANDYVKIANGHFVDIFRQDNLLSKEYFENRIQSIDSTLAFLGVELKKFSQKTLLFAPEEQAKAIASSVSDIKSEQVKYDILYEYYRKNYGEKDPLALQNKKLSNEFSEKLKNIENTPGFAGNFSLANAQEVTVEYLRIYTEFETYSKLKAFLLPTIEKIHSDEIKLIQNLLVVDPAVPPDMKDKPKRSYIIAGSTFGSFVLGIIVIFLIDYFSDIRRKLKDFSKK